MKIKKLSNKIYIFLVVIVVGILLFVLYSEREVILTFDWNINFANLLLASLFHSLGLGITYIVWSLMIYRFSGYNNHVVNLRIYYFSSLAKRIPTVFPYIGTRFGLYSDVGIPSNVILNCILFENILIALAGSFVFFMFFPFYSFVLIENVYLLMMIVLFIMGLLLWKPNMIVEIINFLFKKLNKKPIEVVISKRDLLIWISLYTLPWFFAGLSLFFLMKSIGSFANPNLIDTIGVSSIIALVGLLSFILPGGLGIKEITGSTLLSLWMPFSVGLLITVLNRILQISDELLWSIVAVIISKKI